MSLTRRPRVVIDGIRRRRTFRFFWCRHCDRTVRIASASFDPYNILNVCPLCYNHLSQELHLSRPESSLVGPASSSSSSSSSSASQLLDTMVQILADSPYSSVTRSRQIRQLMIRHVAPPPPVPPSPPRPVSPSENALSRMANDPEPSDQTPSAAHPTADMPIVRVTADMLNQEPTCPVCKDDFVIDEELRAMPCRHVYHSACIMPWLRIHSTCPVCRFELPGPPAPNNEHHNSGSFRNASYVDNSDDIDYSDGFRIEDVLSLNWPTWNELLSLWTFNFRSSFFNRIFQDDDDDDSLNDTASSRSALSWWRFLRVL